MRDISKIEADIELTSKEIRPLEEKLNRLKRELREAKSREFIRANGITMDQIQEFQGDGIPWFGMFREFGRWMKETDCQKRFCNWCGCLHFTAKAKEGWTICTDGRIEHVPGYEKARAQ